MTTCPGRLTKMVCMRTSMGRLPFQRRKKAPILTLFGGTAAAAWFL